MNHFPFVICHRSFSIAFGMLAVATDLGLQWQMKNDK